MIIDAVCPIEDEVALYVRLPVMYQLRPHFAEADELAVRQRRQAQDGYRPIAVWRDGVPVALAGYRQQENLTYGPFLYVDDLVTNTNLCSSGLGNVLMSHFKVEAERLGCAWFALDTPLSNVLGHRLYYRNGLSADALRSGMNTKMGAT